MDDNFYFKLLDALNLAVLEYVQDRSFRLLSSRSNWLHYYFPDSTAADAVTHQDELDYLGNFLTDAIPFWHEGTATKVDSGIWSEVMPTGETCWFEASARNLDNRRILILKTHGAEFTGAQMREQAAKDNLLAFEDLFRTEKDLEKYSFLLESEVNKRTADLRERVKELNCLYGVSRLISEKITSLETIYRDVVNLVPDGFQHPDIACARLITDNNIYATPNWKETPYIIAGTIKSQDKEIGRLEVCYLEARAESAELLFLPEEHSMLAAVCERLGQVIARYTAQQNLQQSYEVLNQTFEQTILAFSTIVEIKDRYTAGHQIRVARIAESIAREMNLTDEQVRVTHIAGIIHDIGKIYVPADILSRPGRLSDLEFEIIKTHSQYGHDILKTINFPWPIAQIVLQHHEKLDGSGYPNRLKGDEILLYTRILTVADVVEAMAAHRPYRAALGIDKALEEISNNKEKSYDADVVDACVRLFREKGFKLDE
ncbi:MAG: HD-GYP domain-containing protein [Dehalococcoidia bacterium]|jgi:HD-GYP domain-containing protein (c-di-GMP phosphodiesterase class II)